jgi:hypothetical protein
MHLKLTLKWHVYRLFKNINNKHMSKFDWMNSNIGLHFFNNKIVLYTVNIYKLNPYIYMNKTFCKRFNLEIKDGRQTV